MAAPPATPKKNKSQPQGPGSSGVLGQESELQPARMEERRRRRIALIVGGGLAAAGALYWLYSRSRKDETEDAERANRPPEDWEVVELESPVSSRGRQSTTPQQLLQDLFTKEALLSPLKDKRALYHDYLNRRGDALDSDTLSQYRHQLELVTEMCSTLERDPEDTNKILNLMQELQNAGEPPDMDE